MRKILLIIQIGVIACACNDARKVKQIKQEFNNTKLDTTVFLKDSLLENFPEYSELIDPIMSAQVSYNAEYLLPFSNDLNLTSKQIAFQFGRYATNLVYARQFQRVQDCRDIIAYIQQLAQVLAMPPEMLNASISQAEEGINNPEVVFQYTDSLFISASEYFNEQELYGMAVIMASGAYIESVRLMYLLQIKPSENTSTQALIFLNIMQALSAFSGDEYIDNLEVELVRINNLWECNKVTESDFELLR